jgi:CubicO group peptidase (beta-lactamase class C family)
MKSDLFSNYKILKAKRAIIAVSWRLLLTLLFVSLSYSVDAQSLYYPERGNWLAQQPAQSGLHATRLAEAVSFAQNHDNSVNRDLRIAILQAFSREPYHEIVGPTRPRGNPSGVIIKNGYLVAQWGEPERVDMTFSVTKSFLSTVAGLAVDQGYIRSVNDRVANYVWDNTFDGNHNGSITWKHLLEQTSDWSGTLFGIHDWTDRPPREGTIDDWRRRTLHTPGTRYQYNDVRVNVLAYSLLHVLRKPLPMVLKDAIMDPIGASSTWRWFGYEGSDVLVDGVMMQSVSGGGHHGGGIFINTLDMARFGLLMARGGKWNGTQVVSSQWVSEMVQPSQVNPEYGYMWWTLKGRTTWAGVPDHVFYAAGFGGNYIIIDAVNDLVIVTRWLDNAALGEFVSKVYASFGSN